MEREIGLHKSVIGRQIRSIAVLFRLDTAIYESTEVFFSSADSKPFSRSQRIFTSGRHKILRPQRK